MNIKQKLTTAAVIGSMAAAVFAPASSFAASNNVEIKNNSAFSWNHAWIFNKKKTRVVQNNTTVANTNVGILSNTGKNKSSFNVGGNNTITTGGVTTNATVTVTGNTNTNTDDCGCEEGSNTTTISGNGAFSKNSVVLVNKNSKSTYQSNTTIANTNIVVGSNTGGNSSSFNVGGGSSITSGGTNSTVGVTVEGSSNTNN